MMSHPLVPILRAARTDLKKFDPTKARPVYLQGGKAYTVEGFFEALRERLGPKAHDFSGIIRKTYDMAEAEGLIHDYAEEKGLLAEQLAAQAKQARQEELAQQEEVPEDLKHLTLNVNQAQNDYSPKRFFCTNKDELVDLHTSGIYYIDRANLDTRTAARLARPVVPEYLPRSPRGITKKPQSGGNEYSALNIYVPAEWVLWKEKNPKSWAALPAKPPKLVLRLLQHVIPLREERNYFYGWLWTSLTGRAFVYLLLCGLPGVGKNRIKLLIRSLHGTHNAADGRKETFGANQSKFNSQMDSRTMLWFDELKFGPDMEPRMKEYQNTTISIERKGVDATSTTEIYASMVVSNNHQRDNYILFNSRKFAPLVLGDKPLTASMSDAEISELSERLDDTHPNFDVKYTAQVAKWIMRVGKEQAKKYPFMEYQGPMFWELAHAAMPRWQKLAMKVTTMMGPRARAPGLNEKRGAFLWSEVEESLREKKEYGSEDYRDPLTVKTFFETVRDKDGKPVYSVEPAHRGTISDFWIKPVAGIKPYSRAAWEEGKNKKGEVGEDEEVETQEQDSLDL